jgi:hypothetical protein
MNPTLYLICIGSISIKKISKTKHLTTFYTKREVVCIDVIALTLGMIIKSEIHAIYTTKEKTITLHCKNF